MKHTFAVALSAAFLAAATATFVIAPIGPVAAELAKKEKSKDNSGMSFNDRRKKCSAEWKEMKAAGKTAGQKWPQFYSECNKRLKGG